MRRLLLSALMVLTTILSSTTITVATNSDGAAALASCNFANGWAGGIELFSLENQSGGSRVWCVETQDRDTHFGGFPSGFSDSYVGDVGSFSNKAESVEVRVNPGCGIRINLWNEADGTGVADWARYLENTGSTVRTFNFDIPDDIMTSGSMTTYNATGRTCPAL
jgi:hypothetical protein